MDRLLKLTAGSVLALLLAAPAHAAQVQFTGTLEITIGTLPTIPVSGSGVADVSLATGAGTLPAGAFATVAIPSRAFQTALNAPVPNAFPIVQIQLAGPGGTGSLQNGAITVSQGGTCTRTHPNVACPGGGLAGFGGLSGSAIVGLFTTHTAGSGTGPVANLPVPLANVGSGSTTMVTGGGIQVTVTGAGWTTGTVSIVNPQGTTTVHIAGSGTGVNTTTTTQTRMGTLNTNPARGTVNGQPAVTGETISLVSPIQVFNTATNEFSSSLARLSLTLTPEPSGPVLVFSALAVVAALYGLRRLRS